MQDLNGKITGNTLTAAEWNEVPSELQNVIEAFGQILSTGDLNQLGKSIAAYAAAGDWYTGGGAADAYTATKLAGLQAPPDYFTGMVVRFRATANNTGASTVNVNSLGVKNIKREDGSALNPDDISTDRDAWMRYNGTDFLLQNSSSGDITPVAAISPGEAIGMLVYTDASTITLKPGVGGNIVLNIDGTKLTSSSSIAFILGDFGVGGSHLDAGSEAASTAYYLYADNVAGVITPVISATAPQDIGGTKPGYHPTRTDERCIGSFWNGAGEDITKFYMVGNQHMFAPKNADHVYSLTGTAGTVWVNLPITTIPLTASGVIFNAAANINVGNGAAYFAHDGASSSPLTNDLTAAVNVEALYAHKGNGSNDAHGMSISGTIPIVDRTTPAISYAFVTAAASNAALFVTGYVDLWAPR